MSEPTLELRVASPVGELLLAGSKDRITALRFGESSGTHHRVVSDPGVAKVGIPGSSWVSNGGGGTDGTRHPEGLPPLFQQALQQLDEYFSGARTRFDLPLALEGTPFQKRVWTALQTIPYGATMSYAEVAGRIGSPRAVRAVGGANGRNPVAIIVPCHRVIAADGSLGGYGGGLERKRTLLTIEGWSEGP